MLETKATTRAAAVSVGADRYFTGAPCKHGHVSERYVSGQCVACREGHYQMRRPELVEFARRHRDQNRERITQERRDNYASTKESRKGPRLKLWRRRFFYSRSTNLRGIEHATYRELASLWKRQHGRCALTGVRLDRTSELDHIVPRARGGNDSIGNLQWVTHDVNRAKRDLMADDFINLCRAVVAEADRD